MKPSVNLFQMCNKKKKYTITIVCVYTIPIYGMCSMIAYRWISMQCLGNMYRSAYGGFNSLLGSVPSIQVRLRIKLQLYKA